MRHIDVQNAIARKTVSDLREAFLALTIKRWDTVLNMKGIEISDYEKRNLLGQICEALEDNEDIMPGTACAEFDLLPGASYREGVARMRAFGKEPV